MKRTGKSSGVDSGNGYGSLALGLGLGLRLTCLQVLLRCFTCSLVFEEMFKGEKNRIIHWSLPPLPSSSFTLFHLQSVF